MRRVLPLAELFTVREPCDANWDAMPGDDRARHCASCRKVVHDLSMLTRDEAIALSSDARRDGRRLCIRVYRRKTDRALLFADGFVRASDPSTDRRSRAPTALAAATVALALSGCASPPKPEPVAPSNPHASESGVILPPLDPALLGKGHLDLPPREPEKLATPENPTAGHAPSTATSAPPPPTSAPAVAKRARGAIQAKRNAPPPPARPPPPGDYEMGYPPN